MMVNGMNGGPHARMAEWGLSFVYLAEMTHYTHFQNRLAL